jgi:peptidoglycan-N-acetylglucosamine deacetylase
MSLLLGGLTVGALSAGAAAAWYGFPLASRVLVTRGLRARCRERKALLLTYDDGPGAELTPQLLDLLADFDAKATFFLLGKRALAAPDVVDRIVGDGHLVGCHSHEHLNAWTSWPGAARRDFDAGYRSLERWVAPGGPYRPPYGKITLGTWFAARSRRRPLAWWTAVSGDTYEPMPAPSGVAEQLAREGGGIALLHDYDRDEPHREGRARFVLETTEALLTMARREGFEVLRYDELHAP